MRLVSIASGSSGNCTYIGSDHTHILVDAGVSCKRIKEGVEALDVKPQELSGIFITHEHSDHIQGLRVFCKKFHVPIYSTAGTLEEIRKMGIVEDDSLLCPIEADRHIQLGDLNLTAFHNTHDAADPVGYRIEDGVHKCAVATDLGNYSEYTVRNLQNLDAILMEANHDLNMLEMGPYPYQLKRRIMSDYGHLSNERCGQLLNDILHDGLKHILLGHLSKENNYPELALLSVKNEVDLAPNDYHAADFDICVAERSCMTKTIEL
jgi:phosphoribosyl 1,2-cyclic phosphodiesterase